MDCGVPGMLLHPIIDHKRVGRAVTPEAPCCPGGASGCPPSPPRSRSQNSPRPGQGSSCGPCPRWCWPGSGSRGTRGAGGWRGPGQPHQQPGRRAQQGYARTWCPEGHGPWPWPQQGRGPQRCPALTPPGPSVGWALGRLTWAGSFTRVRVRGPSSLWRGPLEWVDIGQRGKRSNGKGQGVWIPDQGPLNRFTKPERGLRAGHRAGRWAELGQIP
mmetsp:Transcript_129869/g.224514  ORF Transcript_129869/g.224514 Transcript_129869/m.224514 type:complete len:215 (-) Transcript_129869:78-722(-)